MMRVFDVVVGAVCDPYSATLPCKDNILAILRFKTRQNVKCTCDFHLVLIL